MVICLERGADLHMFQLMPLPLTVFCFSKIQIGFSFLVPAHLGSPGERAVKRVCVCVCVCVWNVKSKCLTVFTSCHVVQTCLTASIRLKGIRNSTKPITSFLTRPFQQSTIHRHAHNTNSIQHIHHHIAPRIQIQNHSDLCTSGFSSISGMQTIISSLEI